jgi:hypothetical protein
MVEDLIARMDRWLAANRADYYAELRPGVSDQALDAFEARFGMGRNGQRAMHFESFQNNSHGARFRQANAAHRLLARLGGPLRQI